MAITFDFRKIPSELFGKIFRPFALVEFKHQTKGIWIPVPMIVDTRFINPRARKRVAH